MSEEMLGVFPEQFSGLLDSMARWVKALDRFCQPEAIIRQQHCAGVFSFRSGGPATSGVYEYHYYGDDWRYDHYHFLLDRALEAGYLSHRDPAARRYDPADKCFAEDVAFRTFCRDMNNAFRIVSGKTPAKWDRDFLNLCRRGLPDELSRFLFRARYIPSFLPSRLPDLVESCGGPGAFVGQFMRAWSESPTLTAACLAEVSNEGLGLDCFRVLKSHLKNKGVGKSSFAWLSQQSLDWVFRAVYTVGIPVAVRYRLKSSALRIPGLSEMLSRDHLREVALREIRLMPASRLNFEDANQVADYLERCLGLETLPFGSRDPEDASAAETLPKGIRWATLVARSDEWHDQVARSERGALIHFPVPDGLDEATEDFDVEWLSDSHQLWREGKDMRHCVSSYERDCQSGQYLVFRLIHGGNRHTAGFRWTRGQWRLDQVVRSCNRKATAGASQICGRISRSLNEFVEPPAEMPLKPVWRHDAPGDAAGAVGPSVVSPAHENHLPF